MSNGRSGQFSAQKYLPVVFLSIGLWTVVWSVQILWQSHAAAPVFLPTSAAASQGEDIATFMIRNAYHFATLYHAARAQQWDLAAYQGEELAENLADTERAAPTYAVLLQQFRHDALVPLRQAITNRDPQQFETAFRHVVQRCNHCHTATGHAFLTIPQEPPQLSIFVLPPISR